MKKPQNNSSCIHVGKLVRSELLRQEHTVTWLADKMYCDRSNIYKIFHKQSIDTSLLLRLSTILKHDFFADFKEAVIQSFETNPDTP